VPALAEQINPHQQHSTEEITIMSLYGDFEFVKAETEYRLERGRPSGWIAGRTRGVRRRMPTRRTTDSGGTRHNDAA
jgi:hypothetical protein